MEGPPPLLHVHRDTSRIGWAARRARIIRGDLTQARDRQRLEEVAIGHAPLAGLVLCASVFAANPVGEPYERSVSDILELNLEAQLALVPTLHRALQTHGRILFFSDTGTMLGWPSYSGYLASKAGLEAAARSLARSLGPRLVVSCLAPGSVLGAAAAHSDTVWQRTALQRLARPEEIARAAVAILRLPASVANGEVFTVDGGRRLYP